MDIPAVESGDSDYATDDFEDNNSNAFSTKEVPKSLHFIISVRVQ